MYDPARRTQSEGKSPPQPQSETAKTTAVRNGDRIRHSRSGKAYTVVRIYKESRSTLSSSEAHASSLTPSDTERAASCSASFFDPPVPWPVSSPSM